MAVAAWLFVIGGFLPLIGFFSPYASKVYGVYARADRLDDRIAFIHAHRFWWHEHNLGFAAGALTVGMAFVLRADDALSLTAAAAAAVGAVLGATFALRRTFAPDLRAWYLGRQGTATFLAFTALTVAAFVLLGVHLLDSHRAAALFLFVWNALIAAVALWLRDVPPFAHFVGALVVGVVLLV